MTAWACATPISAAQLTQACRFILNGLDNANDILGEQAFQLEDWRVIGEFVYDEEGGRHQAFFSPVRDTHVLGSVVKPHERIQIEQSLKYSPLGARKLWNSAGMAEAARWRANEHGKQPTHSFCWPGFVFLFLLLLFAFGVVF